MDKIENTTKVLTLVLVIVALFAGLAFTYNQVAQLQTYAKNQVQEKAFKDCMAWYIPDAVVLDGETYCVITFEQFNPLGIGRITRVAYSLSEMRQYYGKAPTK